MAKTSRLWPYIRAIAKALTIPGTKIGLSILTDIQDQLAADQFQRELAETLDAIRTDTAAIVEHLEEAGVEAPPESALNQAATQLADTECYDVFISYSHKDAEWVRGWLLPGLESADLKVCIDFRDFEIGERITANMQAAIERSRKTVLVLTPDWHSGEWTTFEGAMVRFLDPAGRRRRVLPLLLKKYDLPPEHGIFTYADFTRPDQREAQLERLVRAIGRPARPPQGPAQVPVAEGATATVARRINVPPLPPHYLRRPEVLDPLKEKVLGGADDPVAVTGQGTVVGVQGMGGIGKSVLAAALAWDPQVGAALPDGVIWMSVGQQPDLTRLQSQLTRDLDGGDRVFRDIQEGRHCLSRLLADLRCLIILDDVWRAEHGAAFDALGPGCRLLVTTRDMEVVTGLGAEEHRVDLLDRDRSLRLLAEWAGMDPQALPPQAADVAAECGYLPLALAMAGAMLRDTADRWDNVLNKLRAGDLERIRKDFPHYPYPHLFRALEVSAEALEPQVRDRYLDLAVFPEDTPIPEAVLETFWAADGFDKFDVQDAADLLVARSLARRDAEGRLVLHDLQYDYVRHLAGDPAPLHTRLLEAYAGVCPEGWPTGPDDGYFYEHLVYHLVEAGREEELRKILLDFRWLRAKLAASDVASLVADYDLAPDDDEALGAVQGALRLSAHVLAHDEGQLAGQLHGRLLGSEEPRVRALLAGAADLTPPPWLCPRTPSLTPPGGPLLRTLAGHTGRVNAVSVTPDGRRAVSDSDDHTLKVWDLETGTEVRTLEGHTGAVNAVSVTRDGRRAVSGSDDHTLKVWDLETGAEVWTLEGHTGAVNAVSVTRDGRRAVSGSDDHTLKVWDLETGAEVRTLEGHTDKVTAVSVTPDGRRAVSGSDDFTLKVWDLETGTEVRTLEGDTLWFTAVSVTPDGCRAVSSSWDQTLKVWDLETGAEVRTLEGHADLVAAVSVTSDGRRAVSGSWDNTLKVWDLETGAEVRTLEGHTAGVTAMSVTPDGCRAVSGSGDTTLKVWDLETGAEVRTLEGHTGGVFAVSVASDGRRAVSGSGDTTLKVWDLETGAEVWTLAGHTHGVAAVSVTPDGCRAVSGSGDKTLKVWDLETGAEVRALEGHTHGVSAVSVTPDGRRAVSGSGDTTLKVWDLETGAEVRTLEGHTGPVFAVSVTPDGCRAVSGSDDKTLKVWDLETGAEVRMLEGHTAWVAAVSVTPDGRRAVSGSGDGTLKVWDLEMGAEVRTLEGHTDWVFAVSVTPDGCHAVSGSGDHTLKVWDLETGVAVATFTWDGATQSCAVSPDGRTVVAGDASGRVHFLRLIMPGGPTARARADGDSLQQA